MAFITPWGVYNYRVMPFGLKNAGATYMRAMTTIFHDMIHKEIEVCVDDVIIKSRECSDHMTHQRKFFERLRRYNLKLNLAKCAFEVPAGKLLGFIASRRGIEFDPSKIKATHELPPPKTIKEVISFLGRLNYISQFIAQSTVVCEPIFKLLKKDAPTKWTEECQTAFDAIKSYLSNPPVLVPRREGDPLLLYLSVSNSSFGCVLGQHDETGKKERAIYYISKKFTPYESCYTLLERTCCALTWLAQKLRHFLSSYTTDLISRMDPLKYIFQKPMPTGKLAKWKMLLSEFDIVYVTRNAIKAQALADHLEENPVGDYSLTERRITKVKSIGAVLVSESSQHYPMAAKLRFNCINNMAEYEACILGLKMAIDMNIYELLVIGDSDLLIHQVQADALATISSMIKHPDTDYIDPLDIELKEHPVHCSPVESEPDGLPWYVDIKRYLESGTYPEDATSNQNKSIRHMVLNYILNGEVLCRRTPDLGLLRCVDAAEAVRLIKRMHTGVFGTHMNGLTLARKILRAGYFWMTMENDCCKFMQKFHKYQWVEAASYKSVTKKVVADFVRNNLICRFGVPQSIIIDNGANLNSHLMKEICEQFRIIHQKSTAYRPQMNGAVEAANKNIKKILRKIIDKHREMDGSVWPKPINSDAVKRYYVYRFALKSDKYSRRINTENSKEEKTISKISNFTESRKRFISLISET
nr:uncharacterized protein LOC101259718 [Solanum lycopersicum]